MSKYPWGKFVIQTLQRDMGDLAGADWTLKVCSDKNVSDIMDNNAGDW